MPTAPATVSENYEAEKSHLKACLPGAVILDDSHNQLLRQREVQIQIEEVNTEMVDRCIKMMNVWGWPTNPKKQLWTADPQIGGVVLKGTWRHVQSIKSANRRGMYITLREGFAQAIAWDEAYVDDTDDLQEGERYCAVIFPNVDPKYVDAMKESLGENTTDGFTVDGRERTGTWEYVHKRSHTVSQDGCMEIILFAAQPQFTYFTYENYGAIGQTKVWHVDNVPKRLVPASVAAYNTAGTNGSGNYSTQEGLVDLTFRVRDGAAVTITNIKTVDGCQIEEYTSYYYDYTKEQVEAFNLGEAPQGWIYRAPLIRPDGSGARYTIIVVKQKAIAVTKDAVTIEDNADFTETVEVSENQTTPPNVEDSLGVIKKLTLILNDFCLWSTRLVTQTSKPWSVTYSINTSEGGSEIHILKGNQRTISIPNRPSGMVQSFSAPPRRNRDGTYDWHLVQSTDDDWLGTGNTATYDNWHRIYREVFDSDRGDSGEFVWMYSDVVQTTTVKQFTSADAAYAWANDGSAVGLPVQKIGFQRWLGYQTGEFQYLWSEV